MSDEASGDVRVPVRGILVTHGAMAEGIVDALRGITGLDDDAVRTLSNRGMGPEELVRAVDEIAGDDPAIVFTDLHSGSCTMAARLSCRGRGRRAVVCGVNLPMLLDFAFHREMPLDELVERLVQKGRAAIMHLPGAPPAAPGDPGDPGDPGAEASGP